MDKQNGNIAIIEPESRFKRIEKSLIENPNIDCLTLGIYAKMVVLGTKWQLNVKGLGVYLGMSDKKIRKALVLLEHEGYVLRTPARKEDGKVAGWNYEIHAIPVEESKRSKAGVKNPPCCPKTDNTENRQDGNSPCYPKTDKTVNGQDNNNKLNLNIKPNNINIYNIDTLCEKVKENWNETCKSFAKVTVISKSRKVKIKARVQEMGGEDKAMEVLDELFRKMETCDFLKGSNNNNWKATFDWVFDNDKNWLKVIEGNYDSKAAVKSGLYTDNINSIWQ